MADLSEKLLHLLAERNEFDTLELSEELKFDHQRIVGAVKSLQSLGNVISSEQRNSVRWELTGEGKEVVEKGSHEALIYNNIPPEGIRQEDLLGLVSNGKVGFSKAMSNKWIKIDKAAEGGPRVFRQVEKIHDVTQEICQLIKDLQLDSVTEQQRNDFKKRKLISEVKIVSYLVKKGSDFKTVVTKQEIELTADMIATPYPHYVVIDNDWHSGTSYEVCSHLLFTTCYDLRSRPHQFTLPEKDDTNFIPRVLFRRGSWKEKQFKPYNFNALGLPPPSGHLHPLLKVRTQFRQIFLEMGFSEMPTNNFVESSFWNFDALFQPQQHPARDAHDTFFISEPEEAHEFPMDYLEKVKTVHSTGGYGSQGYKYDWKLKEAAKNIMRTHTTGVSARMLYRLAQQEKFTPAKYFSIDRVFRNETLDATHLAEFHQIEGLVADYGLTLGNLMGYIEEFFKKYGITNIRFKPAYNPYTEPSMEIFSYHEGLGKWVEVGNSGVFRPEMLLPMGLPKDVSVIAWGLSLERPTMIKYGIYNIRELFGPKVNLQKIYDNPLCRLDK